uniref:S100/CaBP-9k-type calcium binding subdomain domain-containing protein n=1 Tax=Oryzias sinensis TaxID=183150 RepID=A0A8C7WPZ3_9TELE
MEAELQKIVRVYLKSSKGKEYLGKKDFQNLVSSQLSNILTEADSKDAVDNMSKSLDSDQNGVGFDDYMKLVGYLACSLSQQRTLDTETSANNTSFHPSSCTHLPQLHPVLPLWHRGIIGHFGLS